jgi:catechol 2,3-dioxygenase-like lactoylglutathione lyase family enzyme
MRRRDLLLSLPALFLTRRVFAQASPPLRVRGINHITLLVSDVKRSVDFYQGLFGMPVISRQGATVNLQLGPGPQFLSLSPAGSRPPAIATLGLAIENFSVDRVTAALAANGVTPADAASGPGLGGALKMRSEKREATPEFFFTDADGVVVQLQDPKYCGGGGVLGDVRSTEPSPQKGLMALRGWSHVTVFGSDATRSNNFYRDVFGARVQAYQGPPGTAPVMGIGGVEFLMFGGGGGGRGRGPGAGGGAAAPTGTLNHICMNMDGFKTETVIAALEKYGLKARGGGPGPGAAAAGPGAAGAPPGGGPGRGAPAGPGGGAAGPLVHYITMRMENRGGAKEGTAELYFTDPDGLLMQLQDTTYCGGAGLLGEICTA